MGSGSSPAREGEPRATQTAAAESFARDAADHQLEVLHEHGLYRHLRFAAPGTGIFSFSLITAPGTLTFTGDMGTYVFGSSQDMIAFFGEEQVNVGYWVEKLTAVQARDTFREFSAETLAESRETALEESGVMNRPVRTLSLMSVTRPRTTVRSWPTSFASAVSFAGTA